MSPKTQLLINLNTADEKLLISKLKISPRLAKRIIALRPFSSVSQLDQVWGIDETTLQRILPLITIEIESIPTTDLSRPVDTGRQEVEISEPEKPKETGYLDQTTSDDREIQQPQIVEKKQSEWKLNLLLIVIFIFGAYFRFTGLNWDQNHHQHPDERSITMIAEQIRPVDSIAAYFDTEHSTLNPIKYGSYTYGMLPLFLTRAVAEWLDMTDYDRITLVGRALSGIFDLLALWMIFMVGKRLFGKNTGILAAALYAAAVFPIQMSHYFTVDSFSTVFVVASFYFALKAIEIDHLEFRLKWENLIYFGLFGLSVGMAGACKVNTLPVFGIIILAGLAYIFTVRNRSGFGQQVKILLAGVGLAILTTFIAFRIFQPYAFTGTGFLGSALNERWINIIKEVTSHVAGYSDWPPNHHWTNRPFYYAWVNMVVWGMGVPLGIAGWIGWILSAWRMWKGDWRVHFLPFTWVLLYFFWQNSQFWRYMRYFIPIYPFLILFAAWVIMQLYARVGTQRIFLTQNKFSIKNPFPDFSRNWPALGAYLVIGVVILYTYAYAFGFTQIYNRTYSRLAASTWIIKNIKGPLNLVVDTKQGQDNYPIFIINRWILNPGDTPEIEITPSRNGTSNAITSTEIRQVGVNILFRIAKQENGDDIVTETRQTIMDDDNLSELILTFGDVTLEQGTPYYFYYKISGSDTYSMREVQISNQDENSPIVDLDFELIEQPGGTTVEGVLQFVPPEQIRLNRYIVKEFHHEFTPGKTKFQISLYQDGAENNPIASSSSILNFPQPGMSVNPTFSFPEVQILRNVKYHVKYEILEGGPVQLLGEPIALETSWDDALPLSVKGVDALGGIYKPLNLELYEPDTPEKREKMIDILDKTEYLIIPSNRAYDSMPRLPYRYPLSTKYYQELFDCACVGDELENKAYQLEPPFSSPLGFDLVATFTSNPSIGPFKLNDQSADESFTVYDHPKVFIFKKSSSYSSGYVRAVLESVNLDDILFQTPMAFTKAPTAMQLPESKLTAQRQGGTWSDMFNRLSVINQNQVLAGILWYLLILVLGWLIFPLVFNIFTGLPDRGYPLIRMAAIILIGWLAWIFGSLNLLRFTNTSIILCILLIGAVSYRFFIRKKSDIFHYIKTNWKYILATEAIFLVFFLFMLRIRIGNPDVWHPWLGGEKPMDFAFFNAVLKSVYFPPENPWFSGHYINYYYYGYVLAAIPTKLTGIVPATAYNLILPTWYAMSGLGLFCLGYNLVVSLAGKTSMFHNLSGAFELVPHPSIRRWGYFAGIFAALAFMVFSNYYEIKLLIKYAPEMTSLDWYEDQSENGRSHVMEGVWNAIIGRSELPGDNSRWYFEASRPILNGQPDTPIAEFPLFTFLYGDLHPHMMTMPFYALSLCWILSMFFVPLHLVKIPERVLSLIMAGVFFGYYRAAHTWDFPIFLVLGLAAITWSIWKSDSTDHKSTIQSILLHCVVFAILAITFYLPFTQWFKTEYLSIEIWKGLRTPLGDYFIVFGLSIFMMLSLMFYDLASDLRTLGRYWAKQNLIRKYTLSLIPIGLIIISMILYGSDYQVLAFGLFPMIGMIFLILFKKGLPRLHVFAWLLYLLGFGLTFLVEVFVLKGDAGRSNMVFRMYIEAWLYFALANSMAFVILFSGIKKWNPVIPFLWLPVSLFLVVGSLSYALLAIEQKMTDRWPNIDNPPHTLDGDAFMTGEADGSEDAFYDESGNLLNVSEDYHAIKFMQENIQGSPVIVEANTSEYRWGSRFSIHTGLPSIIGWSWHIRQHNSLLDGAYIEKRINELNDFYNMTDIVAARDYLRHHDASYIIVGDLERARYTSEGLAKFEKMVKDHILEVVYGNSTDKTTTIYEVIRE